MTPSIDPAIISALNLQDASPIIQSHGGSDFSSTFKITATVDRKEKLFFVKTNSAKDAEVMFAGEHFSLNAIADIVPSFCPRSHAHGSLSRSSGFFLATDFLDMPNTSTTGSTSSQSLASKLAALHSTPAPTSDFGFPLPTCCGSTSQPNTLSPSWPSFYANQRLRAILHASELHNGRDEELAQAVEKVASVVVPRLLQEGHLRDGQTKGPIRPVVVHGDLWSGNHGRGRIGTGPVEEVVFDPSSCYAHSEFDFGIMGMFGGFGAAFWKEYHSLKPKDEPVEEYEDRVELYQLYHHLNHHAMFGGGYRGGAMGIIRELIQKYVKGVDSDTAHDL